MNVGGPLNAEYGVDTAAFNRSAHADDALHYLACSILDRVHLLISSCDIHEKSVEWLELLQYATQIGRLPQVFRNMPVSGFAVLETIQPSTAGLSVIASDEKGIPMSQRCEQVPPVSLCARIAIFCNLMRCSEAWKGSCRRECWNGWKHRTCLYKLRVLRSSVSRRQVRKFEGLRPVTVETEVKEEN